MSVTVRMMFVVLKFGMGWQACLLQPCPGFIFMSGLKPVSMSLVDFHFVWHALENYLPVHMCDLYPFKKKKSCNEHD